ncbi:MAG: DUF1194 domain-containing protein, partial [Rhodospirillaceae bacterium]|nr:DUF1194 domain-containing protein [Rhodospirillaceae bacterium]
MVGCSMRRLALLCALLLAPLAAAPAAATEKVDVELVLAVDGSGSIDDIEFQLQRKGYARAITHPLVLNAIRGGEFRRIAVLFVEWGAPESVETIVDWTVIRDAATGGGGAGRGGAGAPTRWGFTKIRSHHPDITKQHKTNP